MKRFLGISLVAMLGIAPAVADPTPTPVPGSPTSYDPQPEEEAKTAVMASGAPLYELVLSSSTDTNAASAGYVKGAYNATIKAVNKVADDLATVSTTANNAIKTVKVNNSALTPTNGAVNITVASGTTDGTLAVNGTDVAVTNVVTPSATQTLTNKTINVASGNGNTISNLNTSNFASGVIVTDIIGQEPADNSTIISAKAVYNVYGVLSETISGEVNTLQDGIEETIKGTTIDATAGTLALNSGTVTGTVTVPAMDTWGSDTPGAGIVISDPSLAVATALTGAPTATINANSVHYTVPGNQQQQQPSGGNGGE